MAFVIIFRALSEEATQKCIVGRGATGSSRTEMHFKFYGNEQLISGRDDTYTSCLHMQGTFTWVNVPHPYRLIHVAEFRFLPMRLRDVSLLLSGNWCIR